MERYALGVSETVSWY